MDDCSSLPIPRLEIRQRKVTAGLGQTPQSDLQVRLLRSQDEIRPFWTATTSVSLADHPTHTVGAVVKSKYQ